MVYGLIGAKLYGIGNIGTDGALDDRELEVEPKPVQKPAITATNLNNQRVTDEPNGDELPQFQTKNNQFEYQLIKTETNNNKIHTPKFEELIPRTTQLLWTKRHESWTEYESTYP